MLLGSEDGVAKKILLHFPANLNSFSNSGANRSSNHRGSESLSKKTFRELSLDNVRIEILEEQSLENKLSIMRSFFFDLFKVAKKRISWPLDPFTRKYPARSFGLY